MRLAILILLLVVAGIALARDRGLLPSWPSPLAAPVRPATQAVVVQPTGSIAAAIRDAAAGTEIIVEPGEYREQITLKDRVRLVSRVPQGARIRLPAAVPDAESIPAVIARNVSGAELVGFAIIGDSATPLAVGIHVRDASVSIVDVEITGATVAAIEFAGSGAATLLGSHLHDNPGAAVIVRDGARPRIGHNVFERNAVSERAPGTLVVEAGAAPRFFRNVFLALTPESFVTMNSAARLALTNNNWFVPQRNR